MHVQGADDFVTLLEREGDLGVGFGKIWIVEEDRVFTGVESDPRFAGAGHESDDACLTDLETMIAGEHTFPAFAVGGREDRVFLA